MLDERHDAAVVVKLVILPSRSSSSVMMTPAFRKASSRRRWASVSKLNSVVSKTSASGLKVTLVPRRFVVPVTNQIAERRAALVGLLVDLLVAPDLQLEPLRQRVDHRDADAVQAARDLVAVVVELAASVQHREHDFGRRLAALVHDRRGCRAVVDNRDRVVDVDRDVDLDAKPASASSIELSTISYTR